MSDIPGLLWFLSLLLIAGLVLFDYFFHVRTPHVPTLREAGLWSALYILVAVLFGASLHFILGAQSGIEFFSGWLTEKSLSIDNLFVFLLIFKSFQVPREIQQKTLLIGITLAIVIRGLFVYLGASLITHVTWIFYVFGLFLLFGAYNVLRSQDSDTADPRTFLMARLAGKVFNVTDDFHGDKLRVRIDGTTFITPMCLVLFTIIGTDVLFGLDSIPVIYGLTQEPFIVFTATALSLLGMKQLFFLIDQFMDRLVFINVGLAVILTFIGVKLLMQALSTNTLGFINGGQPLDLPTIGTGTSLGVIVLVLVVTVAASLWKSGRASSRPSA